MWYDIPIHFPYVDLDEFVVMPNHMHGIITINRSIEKTLVGSLHATTLLIDPPFAFVVFLVSAYEDFSAVAFFDHRNFVKVVAKAGVGFVTC